MTERIQKRLDELEESAPIVPQGIYNRVEDEWKTRGVKFTGNAADLYKPESVEDTSAKNRIQQTELTGKLESGATPQNLSWFVCQPKCAPHRLEHRKLIVAT